MFLCAFPLLHCNILNSMHRQIRLHELFDKDNHLQALAVESATSPEGKHPLYYFFPLYTSFLSRLVSLTHSKYLK